MPSNTLRLLCALALTSWASASPAALPHQLTYRDSGNYQFNPTSRNLAVYYGKAQNTDSPSLYDLCTNSNVDMIVMGFVRQLNGPTALPSFGFTRYCKTPATVTDKTRVSCPDMAANITFCQNMGKKVLISLGGSVSNLTLDSVSDAHEAASILWNVFGAGANSTALRPFGNVAIDGFDFDFESGADTTYMDTLASSLQSYFRSSSPERYISAAPLCANNTVLPYGLYANTNFVWPRFYNAKACCFGSKGFNKSVSTWYNYLNSINSDLGPTYPRVYLGGLSFNNSNSGFMEPDAFVNATFTGRRLVQSKFGGVSLWEGTDGLVTKNAQGRDFLNVTKAGLLGDI
ncbi:glycoside hydrolase [Aureobasidium pullulans]|nr:glycoside hydrolase [Aureobasidium pullulans]